MGHAKYMTLLHPPAPIVFLGIPRPADAVIQSSFSGIDAIGVDCSVTLPCSLVIGRPEFGEKSRHSGIAFSNIADERIRFSQAKLLGIQHAWDLCRRQESLPFLRLPGIMRIWFWSPCVYEPVGVTVADTLLGTEGGKPTGGGEFRVAMVRNNEDSPWKARMVPACDYDADSDCIALAELG